MEFLTTPRLAAARAGFGVLALFAPGLGIRLFGFPPKHDNATARLLGRLFGVRELALAALTLLYDDEPVRRPSLYRLNAAVDGSDAALGALAIVSRRGIDRAAFMVMLAGGGLAASWLLKARRAEQAY